MARAARDRLLFIAVAIRLVGYILLVNLVTALVLEERGAALWYAIGMVLAFIISSTLGAVIIYLQRDTSKRLNHQEGRTSVFTAIFRSATVRDRSLVMHAIDTTVLEGYYYEHFSLLTIAGVEQYQLTNETAEDLAHDILVASLHQDQIDDPSTWYAAALKHAVARRNRG
ncbi:MAG TPA: hypothetical protein VE974_02810 [Thermoanaerobaculia bacterium]|nr:hypothetical protein [Thermoanaerobaculia bacterium]